MNQLCRVCGEPAAGFHFGAFTCEGCKSFFGRTYNNLSSISECKNNSECVINKKNRTSCKACRLRKCLLVGMSKSGSRYGRRSNWFKIHCLLQEQQQNQQNSVMPNKNKMWEGVPFPPGKPVPSLLDVDNNNSTPLSKDAKDGSISPLLLPTGYGSEAAAALWAARGSLLPVHPHHPGLPFFAPPFLHSPPFHHPPPTNFLLPFIPPRHPPPEHTILSASSSSSSATCSPVPTEDKSSSVSSPTVANKTTATTTSSSSLTTTTPTTTTDNFNYNKSLAVLRSLGPVQETPIDLSFRNCKKNSSDVGNSTHSGSHDDGQTDKQSNKHVTEQSGDVRSRECSLRKNNTTPLDLTCSKT